MKSSRHGVVSVLRSVHALSVSSYWAVVSCRAATAIDGKSTGPLVDNYGMSCRFESSMNVFLPSLSECMGDFVALAKNGLNSETKLRDRERNLVRKQQ